MSTATMNPIRLRVPASFARVLLDDLRAPLDDDERESITDPEQLEYEGMLDAAVAQWIRALDGDGDRELIVSDSRALNYFDGPVCGVILDGLTSRLAIGETEERRGIVAALTGWVEVMAQIGGASA